MAIAKVSALIRATVNGIATVPCRCFVDVREKHNRSAGVARNVSQHPDECADLPALVFVSVIGVGGIVDHDQHSTLSGLTHLLKQSSRQQLLRAEVVVLDRQRGIPSGAIQNLEVLGDLVLVNRHVGFHDPAKSKAHQLPGILQAHIHRGSSGDVEACPVAPGSNVAAIVSASTDFPAPPWPPSNVT